LNAYLLLKTGRGSAGNVTASEGYIAEIARDGETDGKDGTEELFRNIHNADGRDQRVAQLAQEGKIFRLACWVQKPVGTSAWRALTRALTTW
jgi:hypothetical protein